MSNLNSADSWREQRAPCPATSTHLGGRIHGIDPAVDDGRLGDRYAALLRPEGWDGPPHLQKRRKNAFFDSLCVRDLQIEMTTQQQCCVHGQNGAKHGRLEETQN